MAALVSRTRRRHSLGTHVKSPGPQARVGDRCLLPYTGVPFSRPVVVSGAHSCVRACVHAWRACMLACMRACSVPFCSVLFRSIPWHSCVAKKTRLYLSIRETRIHVPSRFSCAEFFFEVRPSRESYGKRKTRPDAAYVLELCVNNDLAEAQSHRLGNTEVVRRSERGSRLSLSFIFSPFLYIISPFLGKEFSYAHVRSIPLERIMDPRCGGILC